MDRTNQNGSSGHHNLGFSALPHQYTKDSFKQSNLDSNTNVGGFVVPDSATVNMNQPSTSFTPPYGAPGRADDVSAWRSAKVQELNPEEHGDYFEPNAEKIYREKVLFYHLKIILKLPNKPVKQCFVRNNNFFFSTNRSRQLTPPCTLRMEYIELI